MEQAVPAELKLLGVAVIIGLVQLLWATLAAARGQDRAWLLGPRDEPRPLGGMAGRLDRAFRNFMETFPLFAAAVLAADLLGKLGPQTLWGAGLYTAARAIYAPVYAAGMPGVRTAVWAVSAVGLVLVVVAIFR